MGYNNIKTPAGFKHVNDVYEDAINYIQKRRDGTISPLKTSFDKFNSILGGGFQDSTTYVIGGRPSVGKSAFVNRILFDIAEHNQINDYVFLYWNWEMPNYRQIIRELSGRTKLSVNDLLSAEEKLAVEHFDQIRELKANITDLPLYFTEYSATPQKVYEVCNKFNNDNPHIKIINIFDHTRLVKKQSLIEQEEQRIFNLLDYSVTMSRNMATMNILLSQLNRNIESPDRINNPVPRQSDFFGADAVAQFANVAMILQRPEMYDIDKYLGEDTKKLLAVHVLKNRDGPPGWIPFDHDFSRNHIEQRYKPQPVQGDLYGFT